MSVATPSGIALGGDEHMLAESGKMIATNRTAIRRRLAIRGGAHGPPFRGRKGGHRLIVAPLAAAVAAAAAVGLGVVLARAERERREREAEPRERNFGLLRGERLSDGLMRMLLGQADLAIELLEGTRGERGDAVHETRKAIKRMRALLRLLRDELGERRYRGESTTLRDVAARLSAARDSEVALATLDGLIDRHPRKLGRGRGVRRLREQLQSEHEHARGRALGQAGARLDVLSELDAFRRRAATWELRETDSTALIEPGLRRLYRQGRRRYRRVADGRGERTRAMHAWRKRVKDLRYAAELLQRRGGGGSEARERLRRLERRADALGETLGEDHDLAVLAELVRTRRRLPRRDPDRVGKATATGLTKAISRRRATLRRRALRSGGRLYRRGPGELAREVRLAYAGERALTRPSGR